MNLDQARFFMVEQQIRPWDVLDPKVLDLLMDTPRHHFVSESQQALAYSDIELPIGEGEFMMAPKVEGKILQALEINEDDSILEIGTGSGYLTALLASLGREVTTVELHKSLQETAKTRLKEFDNINFHIGDASQDWADNKQYDVIVLTGAVAEIPETFKQKLNIGGRLAVICGESPAMEAEVITRVSDNQFSTESLFETDMQYLSNNQPKKIFNF
ncbi:protein-L-isoaspartate O-methyltransferase family protein [Thiomicrorhabdus xiamenensis]|uniref:Protein-L-isoaspartate O-methyltransferase n=1 Tax=Thiomicrorhabdus xiamenensis TaxID=2739063 RepID=A0A7D4SY67_9GAMM|nr:protein-L-isoaspartate O-methyltransferase [Thiomicrorhabdus xiamenensis]QKI88804.1 protein-L-isoaspartate O-methyltransferase [Thiomicrorhabdus xiamenensis]